MTLNDLIFINLMEECAEVTQAASKCIRFTRNHKYYEESNIERLNEEIQQLQALLIVLQKVEKDINLDHSKVEAYAHKLFANLKLSIEMTNKELSNVSTD